MKDWIVIIIGLFVAVLLQFSFLFAAQAPDADVIILPKKSYNAGSFTTPFIAVDNWVSINIVFDIPIDPAFVLTLVIESTEDGGKTLKYEKTCRFVGNKADLGTRYCGVWDHGKLVSTGKQIRGTVTTNKQGIVGATINNKKL